MYYYAQAQNILQLMQKEVEHNSKLLTQLPNDSLYYQKVSGKKTFLIKTASSHSSNKSCSNRQLKCITKQPDLIKKLLKKEYLEAKNIQLNQNITLLASILPEIQNTDFDSIINNISKRCSEIPKENFIKALSLLYSYPHPCDDKSIPVKRLSTSIEGLSAQEWGSIPYRENTSYLESKQHKGIDGLMYRSKSEMLIAGIYESKEIPFHYDEVYTDGHTLISPDFVFLSEKGDLIYHEHLGLIGNDQYTAGIVTKLGTYIKAGIIPGKNLIFSLDREDGSIDLAAIEDMINLYR